VYIHIIQKNTKGDFHDRLSDAVLSASVNENNGADKYPKDNAFSPQELNQGDLQHHYRQKTNLKELNLLRTLGETVQLLAIREFHVALVV
jgi:hypothetical protein